MTTQEAIDKLNSILGGWSFHAGFPSDAGLEALAVLTALAEENKALARRAEALDMTLCSWMDSHKEMSTERDALKAEVGELNEEIKIQQKFVTRADEWFDEMMKWKARAEKAEAEVATLTDRLMSLDHDFGALVYENQRALAPKGEK